MKIAPTILRILIVVVLSISTLSPVFSDSSDKSSDNVEPKPSSTDKSTIASPDQAPPMPAETVEETDSTNLLPNDDEDGSIVEEVDPEQKHLSDAPLQEPESIPKSPPVQANSQSALPDKTATSNVPKQSRSLLDVSLLSNVKLEGKFSAPRTLELKVTGSAVLNLNLLKNRFGFVMLNLPPDLVPYIKLDTFRGQFDVPRVSLLGIVIGRNRGSIDSKQLVYNPATNQIAFEASHLISANLLSSSTYTFTYQFEVDRFPMVTNQQYPFFANMTNDNTIDIRALSNTGDRWDFILPLDQVPLLSLQAPKVVSFDDTIIRYQMGAIYRSTPMQLSIYQERALGVSWRLTAVATPLQSVNHTMQDVVYFKRRDGTTVLLENDAQQIDSGILGTTLTHLNYAPDEGLFLDLNNQIPSATDYSTTIEWTLINSL